MANERLVELKAFISFLKERIGFDFDVENFNHRIALQKYVFIAKQLGWDNTYSYNIYVRGPYSPDLANDYYALCKIEIGDIDYKKVLPSLDADRSSKILCDKGVAWLEVAATIESVYLGNRHRMNKKDAALFALERTKELKSGYSPVFIKDAFDTLMKTNLIN